MENIIYLGKNDEGVIVPISHSLTDYFEQDPEFYVESIQAFNGLERLRAAYPKSSRKTLLEIIVTTCGQSGADFFQKAERAEKCLHDRWRALAIGYAFCKKHQLMFQQEEPEMIDKYPFKSKSKYPLTSLSHDLGDTFYSESTIRRYVQNSGLQLQYKHLIWDAEELCPQGKEKLALFYLRKLSVDLSRTTCKRLSELLMENFNYHVGESHIRFVKDYI